MEENPNNEFDSEQDNLLRFEYELEFVQLLTNPEYLQYLAQKGYFEKPAFINFLKYLLAYWRKPEYGRYLQYADCLMILRLLQFKLFRDELGESQFIQHLTIQLKNKWFAPKLQLISKSPPADEVQNMES